VKFKGIRSGEWRVERIFPCSQAPPGNKWKDHHNSLFPGSAWEQVERPSQNP
jgi:hypothetical protein